MKVGFIFDRGRDFLILLGISVHSLLKNSLQGVNSYIFASLGGHRVFKDLQTVLAEDTITGP